VRLIPIVIGVLITLAGIVWALQGGGMILGSFMSNNPSWIWIGGGTAVVGLLLVTFGLRSSPPTKNV
jgi:hypothetical protein